MFLLEFGLDLRPGEPVLAIGPADRVAHGRQRPVIRGILGPLRIADHRRRHEIVHRDFFFGEEIVELHVVTILGGAADPLAVTDNQVAEFSFRVELIKEAICVARPRDELILHLNAGFGGEVLRKLHQSVGRVPRRPAQRQLFCLSKSLIANTRGDDNRGHPQCTHDLDHHDLPVLAGDCLLALPIPFRHSAVSTQT